MKLLIIAGSYPPDVCGVADTIPRLMNTEIAKDWELYYTKNWEITSFFKHIKKINSYKMKYIIMQFPMRGYGWSLIPHFLSIYYSWFTRKCFGVIIHEQSQQSVKAYLAELLILISANRLIFTNQFERNHAIKRIPFMSRRSTVVKIYSNISIAKDIKAIEHRKVDILNFGQIMPRKGLEKFIEDVSPLVDKYKIIIAGQIPAGCMDYFFNIKELCDKAGIEIKTNLSDKDVSDLLNNTKISYLPFPDGVSERRGSLFASLVNGAVVVTTVGRFTTPELHNIIIDIEKKSLTEAIEDINLLKNKQELSQKYMQTEMPDGWGDVAKGYENFMRNGK